MGPGQRIRDDGELEYTSHHLFIWAVYSEIAFVYLFTIVASRSLFHVMCIKDGARKYLSKPPFMESNLRDGSNTDEFLDPTFPSFPTLNNYIMDLILLSRQV